MTSKLTLFFDTAYSLQQGEFFPETHQANLKRLSANFPEYDEALIDCLYRLVVRVDEDAKKKANEIFHRYITREKATDEMIARYPHFTKGTIEWALENALNFVEVEKGGKELD